MKLTSEARKQHKAYLNSNDCEITGDFPDGFEAAYALTQDMALVLTPCILGPYQSSAIAFLIGRHNPVTSKPTECIVPFLSGDKQGGSASAAPKLM